MTRTSLKRIRADALAEIGIDPASFTLPRGRSRHISWPGPEPGFGVRDYASGRRVYFVQTRMHGRVRDVTIGPASVLTLHKARTVARYILAHALVGNNPAEEKKRIARAGTMDEFMEDYWRKCAPTWKPSTRYTQGLYRRDYIDGAFPGIYVDDLDSAAVAKWFVNVTDRAGPGGANQCLTILRAALNKAEDWGYRPTNDNPCAGVRMNRRRKMERFLSEAELARLGAVLAEDRANGKGVRPVAASAIMLLLLTGCRVGEILSLEWRDVKGHRLKLRDSKTGPRTVWLGDEALQADRRAAPLYRQEAAVLECYRWEAAQRRHVSLV